MYHLTFFIFLTNLEKNDLGNYFILERRNVHFWSVFMTIKSTHKSTCKPFLHLTLLVCTFSTFLFSIT